MNSLKQEVEVISEKLPEQTLERRQVGQQTRPHMRPLKPVVLEDEDDYVPMDIVPSFSKK